MIVVNAADLDSWNQSENLREIRRARAADVFLGENVNGGRCFPNLFWFFRSGGYFDVGKLGETQLF
jgi:hypothetical protein